MTNNSNGNGLTLQDVLDGLARNSSLSVTRLRDLRSAVTCFAALVDSSPPHVALDLAVIRSVLDLMVPIQAKVSRKRWANLRSDLAAAIAASGLLPMLKTSTVELSESWASLLGKTRDRRMTDGLSRFARWASERQIAPRDVDREVVDRFVAELHFASLVRKIAELGQTIVRSWNRLAQSFPDEGLRPIKVRRRMNGPPRFPWQELPKSFRQDADAYLEWAAVPDPLDENARRTPLASRTIHLRRDHLHSAVSAAVAAGVDAKQLVNLKSLVELDTFKKMLRHRWEEEGRKLSSYTHGVAGSLIAIAKEWVRVPADALAALKATRQKLGALPIGLTDKNKNVLRQLNDKRLLGRLVNLPDKLWRDLSGKLKTSRREFIDLQSTLAIDILLVAPVRMKNLAEVKFDEHIRWPQGRSRPAVILFNSEETKNKIPLEFDLPLNLSDRLHIYRNKITPMVTGRRPNHLFVTWQGKPRTQAAIALAIEKTVLKYVGVRLTPHQFRHLAAKIRLDESPGAYELVRELMGHKNMQTTTNFYAGIDTRRAGRAHLELISRIKKLENDIMD
jgi:integrase